MPSILSRLKIHLGALLCVFLGLGSARACTTFVLRGTNHVYFGRNFDWNSEDALVIINPRGVQKTSLTLPGRAAARWTSKYGSLTFNSAGWDLPTGGMNEMGLVVEDMWLDETKYPAPDGRPGINSLQWIQYQLDNCRTVEEVLATEKDIRVELTGLPAPVHYLVCDASGDSAAIEFLNGKMVAQRGERLPFSALANDSYDSAASYAKTHPVTAVKRKDYPSLERFACAAARAEAFVSRTPAEDVDYAFATLDKVAQGSFTVWRIVYDVTARQIHYRTRSHPRERVLDLKKMDFACRGPVQFFDLRAESSEAPKFAALSDASHRRYIEPKPGLAQAAAWRFVCVRGSRSRSRPQLPRHFGTGWQGRLARAGSERRQGSFGGGNFA